MMYNMRVLFWGGERVRGSEDCLLNCCLEGSLLGCVDEMVPEIRIVGLVVVNYYESTL